MVDEEFDVVPDELLNDPNKYMDYLYTKYYGTPPRLSWAFGKGRQVTVERRISKLTTKKKPLYLTVTKTDGSIEEWYVDSGNWVTVKEEGKDRFLGHVNNILPFLKTEATVWELATGKKYKGKRK
tara:strand:+ start:228 stop:602 length:375 start_codon:yes stop_codon:yes gene_type:complete